MFAPARFPALALPEDVGGMLLDDGGVEVACTHRAGYCCATDV